MLAIYKVLNSYTEAVATAFESVIIRLLKSSHIILYDIAPKIQHEKH